MTNIDREAIEKILRENDVDDLHSWRCAYPERFGPCTCVDDLVNDLAAHDAEVRAEERDRIAVAIEALDTFGKPDDYRFGFKVAMKQAARIARAEPEGEGA